MYTKLNETLRVYNSTLSSVTGLHKFITPFS